MACILAVMLVLLFLATYYHRSYAQENVTFSYATGSFPSDAFQTTGDARVTNGELMLTGNRFSSYGRIMRLQRLQLCNTSAGGGGLSFTSDFVFNITKRDESLVNADGLAFLIAPNLSTTVSREGYGRWLGLFEPSTNGLTSNKIIAVEFDTYMNLPPEYPEFQDIDNNHVGIDINGIKSVNSSSLTPLNISLGRGPIAARVQYDARLQKLLVYVTRGVLLDNPGQPVLEHSVNLCAYIQESSYIGFSAGAGGANVDFHRIRSWNFSTDRYISTPPPPPDDQARRAPVPPPDDQARRAPLPPPDEPLHQDDGQINQQEQGRELMFKTYFIVAVSLVAALL